MKALRIFTAIVVAVLTLSLSAQAQNKKKAPKYEEVTFAAHIHCHSCKKFKCFHNVLVLNVIEYN